MIAGLDSGRYRDARMNRCAPLLACLLLACPRVPAQVHETPAPPEPAVLPSDQVSTPEPTPDDGDGCPERLPDEVLAIVGVIQGLAFANSHSGTIEPSSFAELEHIAEVLARHPNLRVDIRAHHDSQTADLYADMGMRPTQREAEAVEDFLIEHGIDRARLTAHGYGESMPLAPNDTPEGRALNRRVELVPQNPAWADDPNCGK
jgi:outer membrane protein OmpA-like peptidoglycan-associated protein